MKNFFKYLLILIAVILITSMAAAFIFWRNLNTNTIESAFKGKLSALRKNGVNTNILSPKVYKNFPYITVYAKKATISSNQIHITIKEPKLTISLFKLIIGEITARRYIGVIKIQSAKILIKHTNNISKNNIKLLNFRIPILPLDIKIKTLNLILPHFQLNGRLEEKFNIINKSNNITFLGTVKNNIKIKINAIIHQKKIGINLKVNNIKLKNLELEKVKAKVEYHYNGTVNLISHIKEAKILSISIMDPEISSSLDISNMPTIKIKELNLISSNGYKIILYGKANIKDLNQSYVDASISTNYINISLLNLGKKIKEYVPSGKIRFSNIKINGRISAKAVKTGKIYVKQARFRIDKKSTYFKVKKGLILIKPHIIKAEGSGWFDKIFTPRSIFVVYRKKGFPCDMYLYFQGKATKLAQTFLEQNIFSKHDLLILGKTENLSGDLSAKIEVKRYLWSPKPYFDFTVNITSKGVSLNNSHIPNGYIKTYGNITIKRITKNGKTKNLYIIFKNFKAQTQTSILKTDDFKLDIEPKLKFNGDYNLTISSNDLKSLASIISKKEQFKIPKINKLVINGTINGDTSLINTKCDLFIISPKNTLKAALISTLKYPLLHIKKLKLQGIGNLTLSLDLDIKSKEMLNLRANADNLSINSLSKIINLPDNISGIVSGNINMDKIDGRIEIKNGWMKIKYGNFKWMKDVNASLFFKNNEVYINDTKVTLLSNHITITQGLWNREKHIISFSAKSNKITINLDKVLRIKEKNNKNKHLSFLSFSFTIPDYNINMKFKIKKLIIKSKKDKEILGPTRVKMSNNNKMAILQLISKNTNINLNYYKSKSKLKLNIIDKSIWKLLTKCGNKKTIIKINGHLFTKVKNKIDPKTDHGRFIITAKNGCFSNISSIINIFSLLNPFESIISGITPSKIVYSKIHSNIYLKNSTILVKENDPIILKGNINIFAYGSYYIPKNTIDAYVTFITFSTANKIISNIPIIGWIIGGKEKSFTGLSFHVEGNINDPSIKPIPLKNLAKGVLGVVKRTLMIPLKIFGVK